MRYKSLNKFIASQKCLEYLCFQGFIKLRKKETDSIIIHLIIEQPLFLYLHNLLIGKKRWWLGLARYGSVLWTSPTIISGVLDLDWRCGSDESKKSCESIVSNYFDFIVYCIYFNWKRRRPSSNTRITPFR